MSFTFDLTLTWQVTLIFNCKAWFICVLRALSYVSSTVSLKHHVSSIIRDVGTFCYSPPPISGGRLKFPSFPVNIWLIAQHCFISAPACPKMNSWAYCYLPHHGPWMRQHRIIYWWYRSESCEPFPVIERVVCRKWMPHWWADGMFRWSGPIIHHPSHSPAGEVKLPRRKGGSERSFSKLTWPDQVGPGWTRYPLNISLWRQHLLVPLHRLFCSL